MKMILSIVFYALGSLALGFLLGRLDLSLPIADSRLVLIAGIATGVFYVLALVLSVLIYRANQRKRSTAVGLQKKDTILRTGFTYTVKKNGQVRPGEYKVMATEENSKSFNIRVNAYVKEYRHNTTLVLAEGDTISAISGNVILR